MCHFLNAFSNNRDVHVLQKGAILTIKTSLLTVKHKQNEQGLPQKAKFDKKEPWDTPKFTGSYKKV